MVLKYKYDMLILLDSNILTTLCQQKPLVCLWFLGYVMV